MAYRATVLPVMIASPGDVQEYRSIARDVLHEWNYVHSLQTGVVLMPVGWETHSSPELGATAQELINDRVLEDCDLLVGVFWTRLGTPTTYAASGTVEEIQRHVNSGKPAMVYFSSQPLPPDAIDPKQHEALKTFRSWCVSEGLIEKFSSPEEFRSKLRRQIQISLDKNQYLSSLVSQTLEQMEDRGGSSESSTPSLPDSLTTLPEAKQLLLALSEDQQGLVLALDAAAGRHISVGSTEFGTANERRVMARWDQALELLRSLDYIRLQPGGGPNTDIYQITQRGFEAADRLQQA